MKGEKEWRKARQKYKMKEAPVNGTQKVQQIGSLRSDERNLMRDMLDTEPKQTACQVVPMPD